MKLVKDVKQTLHALGILSVMRFTVLKIAVINAQKPGYPCWMSNESTWFKDKCKPFYSCFGNCQRLVYKISAYEVCIICPKLISACKIHCKSQSTAQWSHKQRFLTPGHQGWNDLHSLCRIGMEYYLLNNDDNNIIYWIMMIIIMMMMMMIIIMMTMMIIGTTTIMIMIIIITTTLTMTIMKMIMIKTAQTPCQSLYQDRRI